MNISHINMLSTECDWCDHKLLYFYHHSRGAHIICPVCMKLPGYNCGGNFKRSIFTWIPPLIIISCDCLNYFKSKECFI